MVPANPEARAELEAFVRNWYSMYLEAEYFPVQETINVQVYFGMKVPNPMKAKTKKMVDPKFAMNSLLLRRRFSAGKNASLVFEELAPFSSFPRDNFAACYHLKAIVSHLCLLVFFAGIRVSLWQPLEWKHCQDCKRM